MSRKLRNLSPAREELAAAIIWYEEQRLGLGADFYDAVTQATALVAAQPDIGTFDPDTDTRRVPVKRFPYQVVYYTSDEEIVIVAIVHSKRRPGYWKNRV